MNIIFIHCTKIVLYGMTHQLCKPTEPSLYFHLPQLRDKRSATKVCLEPRMKHTKMQLFKNNTNCLKCQRFKSSFKWYCK